ncbi:peptidoglycan-binding protein [Metabacillus fastidiosus]|uniref:peptidoglycan-binding protein n=1 Tax=Metabacillus fastidiosus TaxID=1458 RepID=UPI003D2779DF
MSLDDLIALSNKSMNPSKLHPVVLESTYALMETCYKEGIYIRITQGFRSMEEQATLYGKGRSNYIYNGKQYGNPKEKIVTNAQAGSSAHNFGYAVDFVLCSEDGKQVFWDVNSKWKRVIEIAKTLGFFSGIDFKTLYDPPHLEMLGGYTVSQIRNGAKPNLVSKVKNPIKVTPTTPPASIQSSSTTIKLGDKGSQVEKLQKDLNTLDYDTKGIDGVFGNGTNEAVRKFQQDNNLSVDGIVGSTTLEFIEKNLKLKEIVNMTNELKVSDATKNAIINLAKYGIMSQDYEITKDYELTLISMMNGLVKAIESGKLKTK